MNKTQRRRRRRRRHDGPDTPASPTTPAPPEDITTVITLRDTTPSQWTEPITTALTYVNDLLPWGTAIQRVDEDADITIELITPEEMTWPDAWGETHSAGDRTGVISLSTIATPNPVLVCHELTHAFGTWDHGPWVSITPCPFVLPG